MSPELFLKLSALDLTPAQMAGVLKVFQEADEGRKEGARARWRKWKAGQPNVGKHEQTLVNADKRLASAEKENKQTNKQESKKDTRASDEAAFRAELAPDLPDDFLDGMIKVRRDKRGQVTGLAARLFRDDAARCGMSIHDAAKSCVTSSWITVKPEYFQRRGGAPPEPKGVVGAAQRMMEKSNGSESIFGGNGDVKRLPTGGSSERGSAAEDIRGGISRQFARGSG